MEHISIYGLYIGITLSLLPKDGHKAFYFGIYYTY